MLRKIEYCDCDVV